MTRLTALLLFLCLCLVGQPPALSTGQAAAQPAASQSADGPPANSTRPVKSPPVASGSTTFTGTSTLPAGFIKTPYGPGKLFRLSASKESPYEKWLVPGKIQTIPAQSKVDLTIMANLNSEISQVGDEVQARVSLDLKDGKKVLLPTGWYLRGLVTSAVSQKRLGRDGYVEVEFDKLVSPDGQVELPFPAKLSTKDNQMKSIAKVVAIDSGYVTVGALAGSLLSVQLTGLPVAIATHGISVGVGAGIGATVGAIGALKRKGKIASLYPNDQMRITVAEPITLPGFNPKSLLSAAPVPKLSNFELSIDNYHFEKDPLDSSARLLRVDIAADNKTSTQYRFFDLTVESDHNQIYFPSVLATSMHVLHTKVAPNSIEKGTIAFSVDSPKHKYYLVLRNKLNGAALTRVPIN